MAKFPQIKVSLTGEDGNAFAIVSRVNREMRRARVPVEQRDEFMAEAIGGDYDELLRVVMRWVEVE